MEIKEAEEEKKGILGAVPVKILGVDTVLSLAVENKTYQFVLPGQKDFEILEKLKKKQDKGRDVSEDVKKFLQKYTTKKSVIIQEIKKDGSISQLSEKEKHKTFAAMAFGTHKPSIEEIRKKKK